MTPIVNPIFFWLIDFDDSGRSITWMLIIGIISGILWAMIPSANTCYTPDNLNSIVGTGKDIINYIVESATEILSMGG